MVRRSLHLAALMGQQDVVALLLENGADVTIENAGGNTAERLAADKGHAKTVEPLKNLHDLQPKSQIVPPQGFKALFDGKSLAGWQGGVGNPKSRAKMSKRDVHHAQFKADSAMRAHWKVTNEMFVFDGNGKNICAKKDYDDFELLVDWKILKGGDSGIILRGTPQVQIWDTETKSLYSRGAYEGSDGL